jgi:ATP-binding cassette subfamily B protein
MIQLYIPLDFLASCIGRSSESLADMERMSRCWTRIAEVADSPGARPLILPAAFRRCGPAWPPMGTPGW